MRLPFLQVAQEEMARARTLAGYLSVPYAHALGMTVALKAAALEAAAEGDVSGVINDPNPAEWMAVQCGWPMDRANALASQLVRCGFITPDLRVIGLHHGQRVPVEEFPEPVVVPRFHIRLKTPEERAQAEAEHARMIEQTRQRHQREQAHREEMKAAKRAAARVYFIQQDGGDRLVKIGTTCRPVEVRLRELQACQPHPLVILAHAPGGRYEEGRLHDRFGLHCVTGEWFRPDAELLAYAAHVGKAGVL